MIRVGKPYITETDTKCRINAVINEDGRQEVLWFETDRRYTPYLCVERSDAYLILLLYYAMRHGHNLCLEAPVTERLYYQVKYFIVEALGRNRDWMTPVEIRCPLEREPLNSEGAVATGFSGGVDSMSTIHLHTTADCPKSYRLTHITFFNAGSSSNADGTNAIGPDGKDLFNCRAAFAERFSHEIGLPLIIIDTNLNEYLKADFSYTHTYRNCGTAMLLQKLIGVYYYSSAGFGLKPGRIAMDSRMDAAHYDDILLSYYQTGTIIFYPALSPCTRFEKTALIADSFFAQRYLNVCVRDFENCGCCKKCLRTIMALDLLGKLDAFSKVFDVNAYRIQKKRQLGRLIAYRREEFFDDLYSRFREHQQLSLATWVYSAKFRLLEYAWPAIKQKLKPLANLIPRK